MHANSSHSVVPGEYSGETFREMDESWRMRIGMATTNRTKVSLPRRRSVEEPSARRAVFGGDSDPLEPEDFSDVFGGPPRSVISRQFSTGDFTSSFNPFFEDVFRKPETAFPSRGGGRDLPEFRIPAAREKCDAFYSDIFSREDDIRRSRSRSVSKSKSSSVLSSEELSPLRPADVADHDVPFSSYASKLRPVHVPSRWSAQTSMPEEHIRHHHHQEMPAFTRQGSTYFDTQFPKDEYVENLRTSDFGSSRRIPSPETVRFETNSYGRMKVSMDDHELNSPSSLVSSLCQATAPPSSIFRNKVMPGEEMEEEDDDDDEIMSSYVIEINADYREVTEEEALGIDEAIAWAKEKFSIPSPENSWSKRGKVQSAEAEGLSDGQMNGHVTMLSQVEEKLKRWTQQGEEPQQRDMEMELLDEDVRLWSAGNEDNIRVLLSTLHHILWLNSGWYAIPLTNLADSSQVKKAYQKARLCLHPDKLQQRGATFTQKYVAEKAFSVLQEAWAAYISQDVFFS